MRIRVVTTVLALAIALAAGVPARGQVVAQLDAQNFSAQELGHLSAELARLGELLDDPSLGPQRKLGQDGWSWESFAAFSAGSLADRGYPVVLARDGGRVWVLVGVLVDGKTVWVPVEPSPAAGERQLTLGRIPFATASSGSLRLESLYLSFASTAELPPNQRPTASFTVSDNVIDPSTAVHLTALTSSDPDGRIVLYRWCIDGGPCVATTSWSYVTTLRTPGNVSITLTVFDNAGESASMQITIVVRHIIDPPPPPDPNCGC